jgi:hypothetical protein
MQSELYQEKKRVSDGDIYYAHHFKRTLEIEIPENYKIDTLFQIEKELYLTAEESLFVG